MTKVSLPKSPLRESAYFTVRADLISLIGLLLLCGLMVPNFNSDVNKHNYTLFSGVTLNLILFKLFVRRTFHIIISDLG